MSRHIRLQSGLRSAVRRPKLLKNRDARRYRQNKAFFDAVDAGWLPGELVPMTTRSGETVWLDFGTPSAEEIAAGRVLTGQMRKRLAARGLA